MFVELYIALVDFLAIDREISIVRTPISQFPSNYQLIARKLVDVRICFKVARGCGMSDLQRV